LFNRLNNIAYFCVLHPFWRHGPAASGRNEVKQGAVPLAV